MINFMKKTPISFRFLAALLLVFSIISSPLALALDDPYTEDLWEITDEGVYDSEGHYVDNITSEEIEGVDLESIPLEEVDHIFDNAFVTEETNDEFEAYRKSIMESWGGKQAYAAERLKGVRENLAEQKERFKTLENQIAQIETRLEPLNEQIDTLQQQVDLMERQIQGTQEKIKMVETMIAEKKIQIREYMKDMQKSEAEIAIQKEVVLDYINLLYEEENKYLDFYEDGGSSTLKLLLADASVSENLMGQEYMAVMEEAGRNVFYDLNDQYLALTAKRQIVQNEQEKLQGLYEEFNKEKTILQQARTSKKELLDETQGKEEEYQRLLEESIQQQLDSAIAIQNLQENEQMIEAKLNLLDEGLQNAEKAESEEELGLTEDSLEIIESAEDHNPLIDDSVDLGDEEAEMGQSIFAWPVPANKITATFHDPTYPKKWGLHQAIDIRAAQGTEIRAPANAYVFQTKDNGNGYSYIILAHKNSLVTVYGHVSKMIAEPGTIVKKGDLIGLSGGAVGTPGAGLQTTGPHLHFEVHKKGEPVNPLDYLPLQEMPLEYVPDEYLTKLGIKN